MTEDHGRHRPHSTGELQALRQPRGVQTNRAPLTAVQLPPPPTPQQPPGTADDRPGARPPLIHSVARATSTWGERPLGVVYNLSTWSGTPFKNDPKGAIQARVELGVIDVRTPGAAVGKRGWDLSTEIGGAVAAARDPEKK